MRDGGRESGNCGKVEKSLKWLQVGAVFSVRGIIQLGRDILKIQLSTAGQQTDWPQPIITGQLNNVRPWNVIKGHFNCDTMQCNHSGYTFHRLLGDRYRESRLSIKKGKNIGRQFQWNAYKDCHLTTQRPVHMDNVKEKEMIAINWQIINYWQRE